MAARAQSHTPRAKRRADEPPAPVGAPWERKLHIVCVPGLLILCAVLAVSSLIGDSITFDETSHLTTGVSYWKTGDFRYTPDHPPLGKLWAALPLLFVHHDWPERTAPAWVGDPTPDSFELGRQWLFDLNDGQRLLVISRCMTVLLLLGTCLVTYALARRLWGPRAALLALALAALSPTLLAHGRLVTTDMPITFCTAASLLAFARLAERVTWGRLALAALALAAASLAKLSWPMILPALAAMVAVVVLRRRPLESGLRPRAIATRARRVLVLSGAGVVVGLVVWLGIWTCFRWRYDILAPLPPGAAAAEIDDLARTRMSVDRSRAKTCLGSSPASLTRGLVPSALRFVDARRLLPEAYVLGLAQTLEWTSQRRAYLMGQYSGTGWRSYFPIAFAIKTPVATQLLILAGLAALVLRRARAKDSVLLAGLLIYAVVFGASLLNVRLNIGHRHMLPLYPVLFVLAGGAAAWWGSRAGQVLVGAALVWLASANFSIYPNYLAYFNELIGGPASGHLYLADSNLDWGQDLIRLRDYARAHPGQDVKLAYFGSARPTYYLPCTALPSHHRFVPAAEFTPGLYAISATQLVGVYFEAARDDYWRLPSHQQEYAAGVRFAGAMKELRERGGKLSPEQTRGLDGFRELMGFRLINGLRHRAPDARVGQSIFVYNLDAAELQRLTAP